MTITSMWKQSGICLLSVLLLLGGSNLMAQSKKKATPAPAPAAPAPSPAARQPGGNAATGGPTTAGPRAGTGPTANGGARTNTGPTANDHRTTPHPLVPEGGEKGPVGPREPRPNTPGPTRPLNIGGGHTVNAGINGRPAPHGAKSVPLTGGNAVQTRSNGRVSDVHDESHGLDIHHGLNGQRSVTRQFPGGSRAFAQRGRPGYIQRSYSYHGHDFARRAYFYHGHEYNRYYRGYAYRGVYLNVYAPGLYYGPGFYGWAYNPWGMPVAYAWGWGASPWIAYYGFAPYPTYAGPPYWLTDYMISQDLAANYQAAQDTQSLGSPSAAEGSELTTEVKQQIADEVKYQVALESSEAQQTAQSQDPDPGSSGIGRLLTDGQPHTFVAGADLDVVDASGNECALSGGDVLKLNAAPAPDAEAADLVVLASKGGQECQQASTVTVALGDLQEMQNHMRETIDQGMQTLQAQQGTKGLPAAPPSAQTAPQETLYARIAPPPDPNGEAALNQQLQDGNAAEQQVVAQAQAAGTPIAAPPPEPAGPPPTISLGQSLDQVTGALGQPQRVFDLGSRKIYQYPGMKITFKDGKVSDVQ